jgi:peptidoglycan/LPS O-acetylase OafA/YrhL
MTPPEHPTRLPSLTGLRWFAAMAVFIPHCYYNLWFDGNMAATATRAALTAASAGVGFFFVLSGFVLTWSAHPDDTPGTFVRRRLAKIYPNHVVTWAVAAVLIATAGQTVTAGKLLPNLLLVQSWVPGYNLDASANGVSWSLACELFFYLCFPVLLPLLRKIGTGRLRTWIAANIAGVILMPVAARLLPDSPRHPALPVATYQHWFVYVFPGARLLEFTLGILLALAVQRNLLDFVRRRYAFAALLLGTPVALKVSFLFSVAAALIIPMALFVVAYANRDVGERSTVLSRPFLVWLGGISFAFYLVHYSVLTALYQMFGFGYESNSVAKFFWFAAIFAGSVAGSWALYAWVETPAMRRFGGRSRRTGPPLRKATVRQGNP